MKYMYLVLLITKYNKSKCDMKYDICYKNVCTLI